MIRGLKNLTKEEKTLLNSTLCHDPKSKHKFTNWSRTFDCEPFLYLAPTTENEVIEIINFARKRGLSVKPIGSGHSPSDLACTDGIMLNMDKMNRVMEVDLENHRVTVEAGIRLKELHLVLKKWNLALSSIGSISDQSLAGVIATATHGTGIEYGCFSSIVVDLVLVDGLGRRHYCSSDVNEPLFNAARCSLGALGIITQLTIQCEPAFLLKAVQVPEKLDYILDNLIDLLDESEHMRFWWFPHTDDTVLWKANRTKEPVKPLKEGFVMDKLFGFHFYQFQLMLARYMPSVIPSITKSHYQLRFNKKVEWVDESYKVFNFDCLFPQYVNEWAVPVENTRTALNMLRALFTAEPDLKVHFPVEVRFVKKDNVMLSPCYNQYVCYIGVIMYRPYYLPVPYKKYWKAYEDIMRSLRGRPHWAKAHKFYYFDFLKAYPEFPRFLEIRQAVDPEGIFLNDYLKRHIMPPSAENCTGPLSSKSGTEKQNSKL
ncbi:L-gulonolactone oxidase [Zancudomyces culisetae]|uniref:D-arabinono-1,4-lactone oxidase n=1 Tax=Zancudomyces culisetae TaxID=1213189 RepID=A0A1R1PYZ7_ZANCU|nr:L-gulonolactone oxidase [Zancudomyces culisetae]|eukprot:OMH86159.1 L-gulonolactone oxidase [Zancudomyces culisetae]